MMIVGVAGGQLKEEQCSLQRDLTQYLVHVTEYPWFGKGSTVLQIYIQW